MCILTEYLAVIKLYILKLPIENDMDALMKFVAVILSFAKLRLLVLMWEEFSMSAVNMFDSHVAVLLLRSIIVIINLMC